MECDSKRVDEVLEGLIARRRRCVLASLLDAGADEVSFERLVDRVVEQETHSSAPDRVDVAASLHHQHLPKLAEAGLIQYDPGEAIAATDTTELAGPYLELASDGEEEP